MLEKAAELPYREFEMRF